MDRDSLYMLVTEAIERAENLEDLGAPGAHQAHLDVSLIEERIAALVPASEVEGAIARRGAVRHAVAAGAHSRANDLTARFVAEDAAPAALQHELRNLLAVGDEASRLRYPRAIGGDAMSAVKLAVIEDDRFVRETTIDILRSNYSTAAVVGFANVEQMSEAEDGPFNVVVMDLQLRGGDVEGSDAVRASTQRGRVLVFSSLTSGEALRRAHTAGAQGYVSKDTSPVTLIEGVDTVLAGRPFVDPELQAKIGASERKLLTERQQEVLRLEALGCSVTQIALELDLTEARVRRHIERIIEIYPDRAKADRVRLAIDLGLVTPWAISQRYPPPLRLE
jgi:two-component system response regulator DesR